MRLPSEVTERHTLSVIVDNEAGILARIAGLFSARGYNIESLTVADVSEDFAISRMTIVTAASDHVVEQIIAQLDRLIAVHSVRDLTADGRHVERELALVKIFCAAEQRTHAMHMADIHQARVVDSTTASFVVEITGDNARINEFLEVMRRLGTVEVSRTGVVAIQRDPSGS